MANLTINDITQAGTLASTSAAAGGGDTLTPTPGDYRNLILYVNNGGGASITVTIDDPTSTSPVGATTWNPDQGISVTNATAKYILIDVRRTLNTGTGLISITYSGVTSVTVGAYRVP